MTDNPSDKFDPFHLTGFSFSYLGEGAIKITTSGYISSVIVRHNKLEAIFRAALEENYSIHTNGGKNMVFVSSRDNKGFSLTSCDPGTPLSFFDNLSAVITRFDPECLKSDEMTRYLND